MFCTYCGCKLPEGARFCPACGRPTGEAGQGQHTQPLTKVFHFGFLTRNEGAVREVNEWLAEQRIRIKGIQMSTVLNQSIPLNFEVVPSRIEIVYVEDENEPVYQMDYFKQMQLFGANTEKLDNALDLWKADNPNCRVVYRELRTWMANGSGITTLYFMYQ